MTYCNPYSPARPIEEACLLPAGHDGPCEWEKPPPYLRLVKDE